MSKQAGNEDWTEVIGSPRGWLSTNLGEVWKYRDLISLFIRRDFIAVYKQTVLGPVWHILQPLLMTFTFTIIFTRIVHVPTNGIPPALFYLSGIVCWNYFSGCLNKTSNTFVTNADIFGKVYFPRLTVPVSIVISTGLSFLIQLTLLIVIYALYSLGSGHLHPNTYITLLPLLILLMAFLGLGVGLIVSSLTTRYRDLTFLITFSVQLMMYATPVIYPASILSEKVRIFLFLNPMAAIIETFRYGLFSTGTLSFTGLAVSVAMTIIIFLAGLLMFHRVEKNFMDTV